uniref:Serine/threonine-protein kinase BRSK2 n=1 Tax=Panagrolaimus sp. PS1159 TaxID=55785 RepID=A0AC35ESN8_9BILA
IHELSHSVVGQNSFKVEYKRGPAVGGGVFSRGVKMQVDIIVSNQSESPDRPLYVVQFTLLAGPTRRFRRLVDHLSAVLQSNSQQRTERAQQAALMVRPRRLSDSSVSSACSENETNYVNNIPGISANALPHVRSQNDRVESRSYVCSRSGSNASNTGISSSNVNKNVRIDHQSIAGGSLRISSTSTSANNAKNRRNTTGAVLDDVVGQINATNLIFGHSPKSAGPSKSTQNQQQQRIWRPLMETLSSPKTTGPSKSTQNQQQQQQRIWRPLLETVSSPKTTGESPIMKTPVSGRKSTPR